MSGLRHGRLVLDGAGHVAVLGGGRAGDMRAWRTSQRRGRSFERMRQLLQS